MTWMCVRLEPLCVWLLFLLAAVEPNSAPPPCSPPGLGSRTFLSVSPQNGEAKLCLQIGRSAESHNGLTYSGWLHICWSWRPPGNYSRSPTSILSALLLRLLSFYFRLKQTQRFSKTHLNNEKNKSVKILENRKGRCSLAKQKLLHRIEEAQVCTKHEADQSSGG